MSYNRAPAADLAPWIARLYVTKVDVPADYTISCGLFVDTAAVRIQLAGDWTAHTAEGPVSTRLGIYAFGPQTRRMPILVTGAFVSLGCVLRPGIGKALRLPPVGEVIDRVLPSEIIGLRQAEILGRFKPAGAPEEWLGALEQVLRRWIVRAGGAEPDPLTAQFEAISLRDPGMSVTAAAAECGVDRRKLERVVRRDFGLSPKQVLRRARALDMASHLRGVADRREGEEIALRYYDESHMIHEFTALFGMPPRQFVQNPQPIMTLALESRQARRLEVLQRLQPGQARPWET